MTKGLKYWNVGSILPLLFFSLSSLIFPTIFYANIYTIKGHPYEMQSPALGPRFLYEDFSHIGQKCDI